MIKFTLEDLNKTINKERLKDKKEIGEIVKLLQTRQLSCDELPQIMERVMDINSRGVLWRILTDPEITRHLIEPDHYDIL